MADRKFVRIPAKDLPDVFYQPGTNENVYFARYRVVSEDGRLSSRWSPKFEIPTNIPNEDINITASEELWDGKINSGVLSFTWNVKTLFDTKKLFVNKFHVYVRFHNNQTQGAWQFLQEIANTNFAAVVPPGMNKADVLILLPTYRGLDATVSSVTSPADQFPESVIIYAENIG